MLPDLRFAIGAVLASALLIVAAFGLAATVRVAHHQTVSPDDPWRTLSFNDPTDWGLLAERSRPTTATKIEPPEAPAPKAVATKEAAALDPPPATIVPSASEPAADPPKPAPDPDVVAAIPAPGRSMAAPPNVAAPSLEDEPLEPSERVGALPNFPTAGPGFVPPEHPIALPGLEPSGKAAVKTPIKKRRVRRRLRPAPLANTGYPLSGFPDTKWPDARWTDTGWPDTRWPDTRSQVIGNDKKRTVD